MNNCSAIGTTSRTVTRLVVMAVVLGVSGFGYAKAPAYGASHAAISAPSNPGCTVEVTTGTVDGFGAANTGLPLELEVIRSVGEVELEPQSMSLLYGVPEAADEASQVLATRQVTGGFSREEICTQLTLFDVGPKGEDLVGYSCLRVPLTCGMNAAPVASDVALCLDHQVGVDGSCPSDAFSVVRFTYTFTNPELEVSEEGLVPTDGPGSDAEESRCTVCDAVCQGAFGGGSKAKNLFEPRYPLSGDKPCTTQSGAEGEQWCYTQGFDCKSSGSPAIGPFYEEICGECIATLDDEASAETELGGL